MLNCTREPFGSVASVPRLKLKAPQGSTRPQPAPTSRGSRGEATGPIRTRSLALNFSSLSGALYSFSPSRQVQRRGVAAVDSLRRDRFLSSPGSCGQPRYGICEGIG
jgi:hypothetical protein